MSIYPVPKRTSIFNNNDTNEYTINVIDNGGVVTTMRTEITDLSANKQDVIVDLSSNGFLTAGSNISFVTTGSNISVSSTSSGGVTPTHGWVQGSLEITDLNSLITYTNISLTAGSYFMTVYPNFNLISTDNTLLWDNTTCNTDIFSIQLTGVDYTDPANPQDINVYSSIPQGLGVDDRTTSVSRNKKLGSMTFLFELPADQSVVVSAKFSSLTQSRSTVVDISPLSIDTELTFTWIKLA